MKNVALFIHWGKA